MVEIAASILNVEKGNSTRTFYNLETSGIDYFHIDIMDGSFVEADTREKMSEYTNILKHISNIPLDVHLMVDQDLEDTIKDYIDLESNIITIHYEAVKDKETLFRYIDLIKENGVKAGISIKPDTEISEILDILPYIHLCLIMTVEPGKGGQSLIPSTIDKVKKLRKYIDENELDLYIEVDGGINKETIEDVKKAGADIFVVGSYLVKSDNYEETIKILKT